MREMISLKEITIAFVTFFGLFFIIAQINIIKRMRRIREAKRKITDFSLSEATDLACCIAGCCGGVADGALRCKEDAELVDKRREERENRREQRKRQKEYDASLEEREKKKELLRKEKKEPEIVIKKEAKKDRYSINDDDIRLVIEIAREKKKTSIAQISNETSISEEGIKEIISRNADYAIEDDYVINLRIAKEEYKEWKKRRRK
jgi:hypothetical protein